MRIKYIGYKREKKCYNGLLVNGQDLEAVLVATKFPAGDCLVGGRGRGHSTVVDSENGLRI